MITLATEERIFEAGYRLFLFAFIGLGLLALVCWEVVWLLGIPIGIGIWVLYCLVRTFCHEQICRREFELVFSSFTESGPRLKCSSSYGWPSFVITFQSEDEYHLASQEGLIDAFKERIQKLLGHLGDSEKRFDAELAVYATWKDRNYGW